MSRICCVSIPSRGFWFFEDTNTCFRIDKRGCSFQSPRGDFGFLKKHQTSLLRALLSLRVSIPSRGFWFFEAISFPIISHWAWRSSVSIPSRGFWFFEATFNAFVVRYRVNSPVSIPSRGFWFFEGSSIRGRRELPRFESFNPLAGILVF